MTRHAHAIEERTCSVDGRKVRLLECDGGGPTVVLLHGLGLAAGCWRPHLPRLARSGFRALAPDLPGFGQSRWPAAGFSVHETTAWLERFADAAALPPAGWVGHSISCQPLLRLARRSPRRVAALVLAAPTGQDRGMRRVAHQFIGLATDAFREEPRVVAGVLRRYATAPFATIATWVRTRNDSPEPDAAGVRCPVLVVLGEEDPVVDARFARRLAWILPDARLVTLPEAAHAVALDPADEFAAVTAAFLRRAMMG